MLSCLVHSLVLAGGKDSTMYFDLPDTVKAVSLIADIRVGTVGSKESHAGIRTADVSLSLEWKKNEKEVGFHFPASATIVATGLDIKKEKDELEWKFSWETGVTYKMLIVSSADSAGNFVLYSGYIFLPGHNKWKLIGTAKINGQWSTIKSPARYYSDGKTAASISFQNVWVQRTSGAWQQLHFADKNIDTVFTRPVINPMPSLDSVRQYAMEKRMLEKAIASGATDVSNSIEGVYYKIVEPGTGKKVNVTDTITAHYKLRIFGTTEVISETGEKPATFPLNVLIKAWQLAVPLVRTGGKLKLVIPSGFAYSIRTRGPKIPPNSILEFDIEVLDTRPKTSP